MKVLSDAICDSINKSSWIRQMFEIGLKLKQEHGENSVCDFSLGNPDLPPPSIIGEGLKELSLNMDKPFALGYMPNGGFLWAREALAKHLSKEQGVNLTWSDVILTCGAAGALNVFFKTVLNPKDEVLCFAPYFVEYGSYVSNHNGVFKVLPSKKDTFDMDLDLLEQSISDKTMAILINSPNNPTGKIYSKQEIEKLVELLKIKNTGRSRPIFLIADEPYRFLTFDNSEVPSVLPMYEYSLVVSSFSKNLSLPGERIGYIALSPNMPSKGELMDGLILSNRILGYVNPPAVGQHLMVKALGSQVDVNIYKERRDIMADILKSSGYEFQMPQGAFYFFPKAPGGDDVKFVNKLMKELVLGVPGSGFGGPGHFRLTFCVDKDVILRSADGFKRAIRS